MTDIHSASGLSLSAQFFLLLSIGFNAETETTDGEMGEFEHSESDPNLNRKPHREMEISGLRCLLCAMPSGCDG